MRIKPPSSLLYGVRPWLAALFCGISPRHLAAFRSTDKPGALHDALGCFGRCDVNMSRIESLKLSESQALRTRIASSHSGPGVYGYMFFVDIEGGSSKVCENDTLVWHRTCLMIALVCCCCRVPWQPP